MQAVILNYTYMHALQLIKLFWFKKFTYIVWLYQQEVYIMSAGSLHYTFQL